MRRAFVYILLNLFIAINTLAQPTSSVRTFSIRDGLPANAITTIKQGSKGPIWIATWNGLCCYDGYRFTTFRGDAWGSDNALSTNRIAAIMPDSEGNVWVRTYDAGLYLFDTHQCRYFNIGLMLKEKYGETIVPRNFYNLPSKHTWIIDENNRMNLRIDDREPANIDKMEVTDTKTLQFGEFIRKVEEDPSGHEWLITDKGMMRYDNRQQLGSVFTNYPETAWKDSKGRSWEDANVVLWTEDRQGTVWQLTRDNALKYYDEGTKQFMGSTTLPPFDKYFVDQQKNLWIYSSYGLSLVTFRQQHMQRLPLVDGEQTRALLCRKDGTTWAGSRDGYIGVYQGSKFVGWLSPQGKVATGKVRFSDRIYTMKQDSKGRTWIGTKGQGLYLIATDGSSVSHFLPDPSNHYSLSHKDVYDIDEDENGQIWIATFGGGVNIVQSEELKDKSEGMRFIHCGNELKRYPGGDFMKIRRITHDGRGNMFFSCTGGLVTCSNKAANPEGIRFYTTVHDQRDIHSLHTNDVMQTLVTRSGQIYVITMGGGVQQVVSDNLQQDDLKFRIVEKMNQGAGNALSLTEDQQGHIWITRETEVNRYDVKKNTLEQFGPNSMEEPADMTEAQTILSPDGSMWIGTTGGLLTFKVQNMKKSTYQPNIIFSSIQYQGEQLERPLLNRQMLDVMEQAERNFTIRFAALDYENNYLMQYAYRMKEDKKGTWNYIGHIPRISFSNMSPGWHTIIVKSTNAGGMWCDNETEFTLYIQPMLWERLWFRIVVLLLVVGLLTWATISYTRYRKRHKEREKRLESIMRQYQELLNQQPTADSQQPAVKEYKLSEPEIVNPDEQMMTRLMAFIEERISDEELRIEDMADAVGMGRTVFYEKIRQLVGVSPSDFLRQVRMQRAQQLLAKSSMTISEIAYNIGFTDPKYFTKCFKKQTGVTPTEYREARS